jgi:REP element-mobilizing transposase RayT
MIPLKGTKHIRRGRVSGRGQYYLLTTSTHDRRKIFCTPETAQVVLNSLQWLNKQNIIHLEAAVVMPDHIHFVARLQSGTLSQLMHSLKSYSAKKINFLLNDSGRIWQAQYHDHAIRKDETLIDVIKYCLNNPVRAKLVKDFHQYPYWYCRYDV